VGIADNQSEEVHHKEHKEEEQREFSLTSADSFSFVFFVSFVVKYSVLYAENFGISGSGISLISRATKSSVDIPSACA
jgi:hypothetical protein